MTKATIAIAKLSLALVALLAVYLLFIWGEPRMADGQLFREEATLLDEIVIMSAVLSVGATCLLSFGVAVENRNPFWAVGFLLVPVLAYPYLYWLSKKLRLANNRLEPDAQKQRAAQRGR
jgi:hypothetical protein